MSERPEHGPIMPSLVVRSVRHRPSTRRSDLIVRIIGDVVDVHESPLRRPEGVGELGRDVADGRVGS
jgi:hypothetical protein